MMKNCDVSVIVPIYGVEKYIAESLRSLFSQTKTDGVEFILVNDCTKDRSIEIAREVISDFPTLDIKIIEHEVNGGVAVTRQTGLDTATGRYTIHFDPDDWCEPNMLEELYNKAIETNADVVISDYLKVYKKTVQYRKQHISEDIIQNITNYIVGKNMGALWNKLILRELYTENNIRFIKGINVGEDLIMCVKVFSKCNKIEYIPKAYYHYYHRPNSLVTKKNPVYSSKSDPCHNIINEYLNMLYPDGEFNNALLDSRLKFVYHCIRQGYAKEVVADFPNAICRIDTNRVLTKTQKLLVRLAYKKHYLLVRTANYLIDIRGGFS